MKKILLGLTFLSAVANASTIQTVNAFNKAARSLPALVDFNTTAQNGMPIFTDGKGAFWVSIPQYDPDSGKETAPTIIDLNIGAIQDAQSAMVILGTILQAATVSVHP